MQQSLADMQVALRVLTAITDRREPDAADVEQLRRLAPPRKYDSLDEMACDVIRLALKHRDAVRAPRDERRR